MADVWNQYEVEHVGDRITVKINGKTVLIATDGLHMSGVIGLQCQPDQRLEFRNVKIAPM